MSAVTSTAHLHSHKNTCLLQHSLSEHLGHRMQARLPVPFQPHHHRHRTSKPVVALANTSLYETQVAGNFVTAPILQRPKGVVHFLGGAFAGAAPQLAYQFLINWVANAGYTVVATPYAVTFRHLDCAARVHQDFLRTLDALRGGELAWMAPEWAGLHGVGHSNGALLHLLIGSQSRPANASNVLISFNNKQVKEAIPVPLDNLQQVIRSARSSSWRGALPTTEAVLERVVAFSAASRGVLDRQTAFALKPALDQIGSVFDEVGDGYTDFVPSPMESRSLIARGYEVPETLLIRFSDDSIDETAVVGPALTRPDREPSVVTLPGSHVTPCGGDGNWQIGKSFTPVDAVALAVKSVVQTDLRRTARTVVQWLDTNSQQ